MPKADHNPAPTRAPNVKLLTMESGDRRISNNATLAIDWSKGSKNYVHVKGELRSTARVREVD